MKLTLVGRAYRCMGGRLIPQGPELSGCALGSPDTQSCRVGSPPVHTDSWRRIWLCSVTVAKSGSTPSSLRSAPTHARYWISAKCG